MRRAVLGIVCVIILYLTVLTSCTDTTQHTVEPTPAITGATDEPYHIAYAASNFENEFYRQFVEYLTEYAQERDIRLTVHDGESDVSKQIAQIEKWLKQDIDAIICAPVDPDALQNTADACMEQGVPFINTDAECERKTSYIGVVQYDFGYLAGRAAADWINENLQDMERVECAILTKPQSLAVIERANGIIDGLLENCMRAEIVAEEPYMTVSDARKAILEVYHDYPALSCVVSVADTGIMGAYQAMLATGMNTDQICLVGIDATRSALEKIAEGTMLRATVDQGLRDYARKSLDLAIAACEGTPVARVDLKTIIVTADNVQDFLDDRR